MHVSFRGGNPFAFLFATTKREQYLEQYVLREHKRGRPVVEILEDAYIRNRSRPEERARLLERPGIVAALGEHAVAELRLTLPSGAVAARRTQREKEKAPVESGFRRLLAGRISPP